MSMSDPIADMADAHPQCADGVRRTVTIPSSKVKGGHAQVLKDEGYIDTSVSTVEGAKSST